MAEPSKFSGLLQQMGIFSPTEKAAMQYAQDQQTYQTQLAATQVAQQGASRYGLFGGPMESIRKQQMGVPNQMNIPVAPQLPDTSAQEQVMSQTMQGAGSYSQKLYGAAQEFLRMGDTQRAQQAYAAALQAYQEEEAQKKQQLDMQNTYAGMTQPEALATVGVAGNPLGRQQQIRVYNPETGQHEIRNQGPSYEIGKNETNVNLGGLLTEAQSGDELRTLADRITAARGFTRMVGAVRSQLQKGGKTGIPQRIFSFVDEAINTVKAVSIDRDVPAFADDLLSDNKWQEIMKATNISKAQLIQIAYQRAKLFDQDGRIAKDDFKNAMDQLGASLSSPEAVLSVLLENAQQSMAEIEEAYQRTGALTAIPPELQALKMELSKEYADLTAPSQEPTPADNSPGAGYKEIRPGIFVKE